MKVKDSPVLMPQEYVYGAGIGQIEPGDQPVLTCL